MVVPGYTLQEMLYFDIAPFIFEIFSNKTAMALVGGILAAQQASSV